MGHMCKCGPCIALCCFFVCVSLCSSFARLRTADFVLHWRCAFPFMELSGFLQQVLEKLTANLVRCDILHTMLSFLTLRILTPRQIAQFTMHS
jgi:hypothetical protein